jgi:hypothetical protein
MSDKLEIKDLISTFTEIDSFIQDVEKRKKRMENEGEYSEQEKVLMDLIVKSVDQLKVLLEFGHCHMPFVTFSLRGLVEMLWSDQDFTGFHIEEQVMKGTGMGGNPDMKDGGEYEKL